MKVRRLIICAFLTLCILAAVVLALLPRSRDLTRAHFNLLRPGMTQREVEHLLYGPPRNEVKYPAIAWIPQRSGMPVSGEVGPWFANPIVVFVGNRQVNDVAQKPRKYSYFPGATSDQGHQAVWVTETGLIAVDFGADGRLQQKYFSTISTSHPPDLRDWVVSRPRMILRALGI